MEEKKDNTMLEWARKEVELAIKSEESSAEGTNDWKYGEARYKSALKAYETLSGGNQSDMDIQIAKSILNRLVDGKPLTPIEDTEETWAEINVQDNGTKEYQAKRMSSFFKRVNPDGTIIYTDISRISCVDLSNPGVAYHNGLATRLVEKIFPIQMPYLPPAKPYRVFTEELPSAIAYLYILLPDGRKIDLNRYFKEENGQLVPMEKEEWDARKAAKKAETETAKEDKKPED